MDVVRECRRRWETANAGKPVSWPGNQIGMYTHGQALIACDLESNDLRPATPGLT